MSENFLRRADVEKRTGLSRSTIYCKMVTAEFPKPVRLSGRCVAWLDSEIAEWQARQIAQRDLGKVA